MNRSVAYRSLLVGLAVVLGASACGGNSPDADGAAPPSVRSPSAELTREELVLLLGEPVAVPNAAPGVVPAAGTVSFELATATQYMFPPGIGQEELLAWYGIFMPKGRDFEGLRWLEELPADPDLGPDWYWCAGPAESLDVEFGENVPGDEGFVSVALHPVSDGACGCPPTDDRRWLQPPHLGDLGLCRG